MDKDVWKGKGYAFYSCEDKLYLIRCFECGKENHSGFVASGTCAWCGYDANKPTLKKGNKVADKKHNGE